MRTRRWRRGAEEPVVFLGLKLEKDFYNVQKDKFNISKVPDIYDSIKYDLLHNKNVLHFDHAEDLYVYSKALADIVVPQVRLEAFFFEENSWCSSGIRNDRRREIEHRPRHRYAVASKDSRGSPMQLDRISHP